MVDQILLAPASGIGEFSLFMIRASGSLATPAAFVAPILLDFNRRLFFGVLAGMFLFSIALTFAAYKRRKTFLDALYPNMTSKQASHGRFPSRFSPD